MHCFASGMLESYKKKEIKMPVSKNNVTKIIFCNDKITINNVVYIVGARHMLERSMLTTFELCRYLVFCMSIRSYISFEHS